MHGAVWHRLMSIFGTQDTSVALRFAYLKSTLFIIEEHPYGVGWYGFQYIYPEYDFYLNNPNVIMYHSVYLPGIRFLFEQPQCNYVPLP